VGGLYAVGLCGVGSRRLAGGLIVTIAVFGLLLFFGLGAPVALWLPRTITDRWSAAPVFGLAIFGVVETLAYFYGFFHEATIALAVMAAISLIACCIMVRDRAWLIALMGYGLLVCVACLAPMWIGGFKFALFQANPYDQFNYISTASGYSSQSYRSLAATGADSESIVARISEGILSLRPTVGIVLAAIRPWFYSTTAEAAYPFQALLQALSAFGALFVLRNVLGAGKLLGLVVATAFAIGFFPQYVSDINAWSSLASLSFGPVAIALVYLIATKGAGLECAGPLAPILAAILYFYPESSIVCALSCGAIALGGIALSQDRLRVATYLALPAGAALLACLPAWQATIGFLIFQAAHSAPWDWFVAFDSFYFADLSAPDGAWSSYRIFSTPIDAIAGLLGIYFIHPLATLPTPVKVAWKLVEVAFFVTLAVTILRSIKTNPSKIFVAGCVASMLLPLTLLVRGDYWTAGKAVTMAAPLFFVVLAFPLTQHKRLLAIPAAILLTLHIGFGFQRVFAATNTTGIRAVRGGYPQYPAYLKAQFDLTLPRWRDDLAGCTHVAVNVADPHLERLVETVLNDLNILTDFQTDRHSDYGGGFVVPAKLQPGIADCTISDQWSASKATKLIYLSTRDHNDLLQHPQATGLHGIEMMDGHVLRWTDGNAQWSIPTEERIAAISISLWADVIPPGASVQVLVNGHEIANQPVWNGAQRFAVEQDGALTISIKSPTFRFPNDPRDLGLALKSVTIEDHQTSGDNSTLNTPYSPSIPKWTEYKVRGYPVPDRGRP
jgi:hypothetical protein